MADLLRIKCPSCGASVKIRIIEGQRYSVCQCDYCKSEVRIENPSATDKVLDFANSVIGSFKEKHLTNDGSFRVLSQDTANKVTKKMEQSTLGKYLEKKAELSIKKEEMELEFQRKKKERRQQFWKDLWDGKA